MLMQRTAFFWSLLLAAASPLSVLASGLSDPFSVMSGVADVTPCSMTTATGDAALASLSLTDVVNTALCANPQTREVWANARAQAALLGVAQSAWLPSLDASAGVGRSRSNGVDADTRKLGLTASWLLYDFGARSASIENARQVLAASNATRDATLQSLFLAAVQAFYQVQGAQASLDAALVSEQAAERSFKSAQARYQAGAATPADSLQAQTAYSQAQLTRISADANLKTAFGALATVMGRDAQRPLAIAPAPQLLPPERFEQDIEALVAAARKRRPDLLAAGAQVKAAEASVDAARAGYMPNLSVGFTAADQKTEALPDTRSGSLGLTLNIPIFAGFATTYKVQSAQAQLEAKQAQAERLRVQVAQDVWNAAQSLVTATQTIRTTADLLASAEQSDRVARGRYESGVGTLLEMLNAQSALASARQQRVQALYSWNVARVTLAQSMGDLAPAFVDSLNESTSK